MIIYCLFHFIHCINGELICYLNGLEPTTVKNCDLQRLVVVDALISSHEKTWNHLFDRVPTIFVSPLQVVTNTKYYPYIHKYPGKIKGKCSNLCLRVSLRYIVNEIYKVFLLFENGFNSISWIHFPICEIMRNQGKDLVWQRRYCKKMKYIMFASASITPCRWIFLVWNRDLFLDYRAAKLTSWFGSPGWVMPIIEEWTFDVRVWWQLSAHISGWFGGSN